VETAADVMLTDVGREIARRAGACSPARAIQSTSPVIAAACSPAG
jgi:hypothetical protein